MFNLYRNEGSERRYACGSMDDHVFNLYRNEGSERRTAKLSPLEVVYAVLGS